MGNKLDDDHSVDSCQIKEGSTVDLEGASSTIQVIVKTPLGKNIPVEINTNDPISALKEKVTQKEGIPVNRQSLVYTGITLDDDQTVADYDIERGSTIDLLQTLSIFYKAPSGKLTPLDVCLNDSIPTVKKKIEKKEGIYICVCAYLPM
jgi:hypothetical protein